MNHSVQTDLCNFLITDIFRVIILKEAYNMKILLLAVLSLLFISCDSQRKQVAAITSAVQSEAQTQDTIPCASVNLQSFKFLNSISDSVFTALKNGWQMQEDHSLTQPNGKVVEYFTLPFADIKELASLTEVDSVRIYLGKGQASADDNGFRLMLIPVCSVQDQPNFEVILDYSNVCPPTCND